MEDFLLGALVLATRIASVAPSATLAITAKAKAMKSHGVDVVNLAGGEPDFDTPDPVKQAAIAAIQEGFTKYTPTAGIPELRTAIARQLAANIGVTYQPAETVVTNGAKQALYNALQVLCQPGDEVLIPSPYWVSYPEMVKLAGATPVFVPTAAADQFRLTVEAVERAITPKTRLLLLNSPSNPTGSVLPKALLQALAKLLESKDLFVISDEIYDKLVYDEAHFSIASLSPKMRDLTLVVNGVSKAYAMTGWRIGYAAGPQPLIEAMTKLQDHSTSNPSSISQRAALAALTSDPASISAMAEEFHARRDVLVQELAQVAGISFVKPQGAFYCFCDISKFKIPAREFAARLLAEAHVAAIPGEGFGWPSHIRLSFSVNQKTLREGVRRIRGFTESLST
ncbi:MAG: pyridoxal phosphate-dependent aminotransferase [Candidatus Omnitrophica bacterium]|nr:pyridoxal phosphate-dependent aminotransferase [Candidatus Omnitrophota bacterium]